MRHRGKRAEPYGDPGGTGGDGLGTDGDLLCPVAGPVGRALVSTLPPESGRRGRRATGDVAWRDTGEGQRPDEDNLGRTPKVGLGERTGPRDILPGLAGPGDILLVGLACRSSSKAMTRVPARSCSCAWREGDISDNVRARVGPWQPTLDGKSPRLVARGGELGLPAMVVTTDTPGLDCVGVPRVDILDGRW